MKVRIEVIASPPGAAAVAVLGPDSDGDADSIWSGDLRALTAFCGATKLLGDQATFSPLLSARWRRLVGCTPEFAAFWAQREDRPTGFFLEVLSHE